VPYFPVIEMLQTVRNIEETDPIETSTQGARRAPPLGDAAVASAPYLNNLLFPARAAS